MHTFFPSLLLRSNTGRVPATGRRSLAAGESVTCLSERLLGRARRTFGFGLGRWVAQGSLWSLLALTPAGCLVASTPEFEKPQQTRPFLLAASADPDIREFVIITDEKANIRNEFSALVMSEDVGEPVKVALYIDYGEPNVEGRPFHKALTLFPDLPAGKLSDGGRRIRAHLFPEQENVEPGCHTVTMIVSHEFDYSGCPKSLDDSSQLTWTVLRCSSITDCATINADNSAKNCPSSNTSMNKLESCAEASTGADAGDGGGS